MYQATMFKEESYSGGGSKIPVGIHTGNIVFNGLSTDSTWTDINFSEVATGKVIHKRLFVPTGGNPKEGESIQDAYNREVTKNLKHIVHIMTALLGDEAVASFSAEDYKTFVANAASLLNEQKGTAVNLKVVPDYKEKMYPELPSYGNYVEKAGGVSRLSFSKKELEAISEMSANRAKKDDGAMSQEDVDSLI